jgi:high-affinity nickel-transport protein
MLDFITQIDASPAGLGVLVTGLLLGIRHGIDWDHIAAITDITSTTAAAGAAEAAHAQEHRVAADHEHGHGGTTELQAHGTSPVARAAVGAAAVRGGEPTLRRGGEPAPVGRGWIEVEQLEAIRLGTLYAVGHGIVVIVLGVAALAFGALLPDWLDPIMARVVGLTLVGLGVWVLYSVYQFARGGGSFRLRSRWMLVFDGARYGWRRLQARLHGHEHVEPL